MIWKCACEHKTGLRAPDLQLQEWALCFSFMHPTPFRTRRPQTLQMSRTAESENIPHGRGVGKLTKCIVNPCSDFLTLPMLPTVAVLNMSYMKG